MISLVQDDDSLSLSIEPVLIPQEKKIPALRDIEIKTNADHQRLSIYFTVHSTYIQNIITKKQKPTFSNILKTKLGANCIIYKEFNVDSKEARRFYGEEGQIKGNIHLLHNLGVNIEFKIWFSANIKKPQDFIWMFFNYNNHGVWKTKSYQFDDEENGSTFACKIPIDEFRDYMEPNLLLTIAIKKKQNSNTPELGIVNLGNTCYMNSCLQMLFYIRPLRKLILDTKSDNKLIKELREVFIMLMEKDENKAIDAQQFLESYEKYNQLPRRQQDVQEFLLDFINEIELECPEVKSLWQGKCSETTQSVEQGKNYNSVQNEQFAQLDVHLFDAKERPFQKIEDSLQEIMKQEEVEDMIDHDEFGKIKVAKYRTFLTLPDVLFVNLKRYEWNKDKMRLSKIFSPIKYGETLNLGFIVGTPGNDQYNPDCDYTLYSVIVHKGTSPHNGHYFVFANTSSHCSKPNWICFNDSITTKSDPEEVLQFTGQKTRQTILDKNIGRFIEKQIQSDSSSYLLVYIRKNVFNDYQNIKTSIPKDYLNEKIKKNVSKKVQSLQDINVFMVENHQKFDIFDKNLDFMQIPMPKSVIVQSELKRLSKQVLGTEGKLFYRVYANERAVKRIQQYEITSDLLAMRRGYPQMTYVLALTQSVKYMSQSLNLVHDSYKPKEKSILIISRNDLTDIQLPELSLASPKDLIELEKLVDQKNARLICMTPRVDFEKNWNRYLDVEIHKNDD